MAKPDSWTGAQVKIQQSALESECKSSGGGRGEEEVENLGAR